MASFGLWAATTVPILLLIVLLAFCQWSASKAAVVAVVVDAVIALFIFHAPALQLLSESLKGIWSSLSILIIVWPAILLYEVQGKANAFSAIRNGMKRITPNELLQILVIGYVLVSFLQGITGFGVPVAVCAPLLIGLGIAPVWALIITLLAQAWGNTFGTLSAAWDALAAQTGLPANSEVLSQAAFRAAVYLFFLCLLSGLLICWFYGKGKALRNGFPAVLLLALLEGGGELLLSRINPTLCCFVPCCAAILGTFLLGKLPLYRKPWRIDNSPIMDRRDSIHEEGSDSPLSMTQAFSPYLVLTALTLICLLIPAVKSVLGRCAISLSLPAMVVNGKEVVSPLRGYSAISLTNAGFFLLAAAIFGYWYFRRKGSLHRGDFSPILRSSLKKTLPSAISIILFLILANMMSGTGQTQALAAGFAAALGNYYAVLSPLVGVLGSFLTGSNMSSNILFCNFQTMTAQISGMSTAPVLAAQTVGGSIGSMISPSKIVLGATTTGTLGSEGKVLRRLLPIALVTALGVGISVWLAAV